ncbi:2TM domain-containing protein [uncultured Serinicoccus sp.]|uniref:2TM domain-containing protein n=1 Tax=uncultured Serinicoccus sp. TaxID=735514 RepID=UPI0026047C54|nr:2TM domain-containing protein [uncultured Serinicoccus sp.]
MTIPVQGRPGPFDTTGATGAPPPLPVPGTGGAEELPGQPRPGRVGGFPACGPHGRGGLTASRDRVVRAAALIGLLIAVWAVSGGGHFWPVWVMIGWGFCLVPDVARILDGRAGRGRGPF